MEQQWAGEERRGIPIHILNYVDEKLDVHTQKVEHLMQAHVGDEMARYQLIEEKLERNNRESERRHHSLIQSITAFTGNVEMMQQAFLRTQEGQPDYIGHFNDHNERAALGLWWKSVKDKALTKLIEWGVVVLAGWIGYSLWQSFLQGPK